MGIDRCNWDTMTECRHPLWFKTAQDYLDGTNLSMVECIEAVEQQFAKLKDGCKICIQAEIARQLRLLAVRSG